MAVTPPPSAPGALQAFVRGIERRAFVLAEAQCGQTALAYTALAATLARFRHEAPACPPREWPVRFWSALLARPEWRGTAYGSDRGAVYAPLATLSSGPRAALLLHLAAGLELTQIATALGVSTTAARLALGRAVCALGQANASADGSLTILAATLQARARELPETEQRTLAALRQRSLRVAFSAPPAWWRRIPRRQQTLWLGLGLVAALFAATFALPPAPSLAPGEAVALPTTEIPPMTPEATALASPDFELLLDPQTVALADDLDFYAWLAAQDAPHAH